VVHRNIPNFVIVTVHNNNKLNHLTVLPPHQHR